eukprot:m.286726 g.286726  ORF g.286726 m.286726 type:complete len:350 (-) comp16353_c1_seq1:127-1176(-)
MLKIAFALFWFISCASAHWIHSGDATYKKFCADGKCMTSDRAYNYIFYDDGEEVDICFDACWATSDRTAFSLSANYRYAHLAFLDNDGHARWYRLDPVSLATFYYDVRKKLTLIRSLTRSSAEKALKDVLNKGKKILDYGEFYPTCSKRSRFYGTTKTISRFWWKKAKLTTGYMHEIDAYFVFNHFGLKKPTYSNGKWCRTGRSSVFRSIMRKHFDPFNRDDNACERKSQTCRVDRQRRDTNETFSFGFSEDGEEYEGFTSSNNSIPFIFRNSTDEEKEAFDHIFETEPDFTPHDNTHQHVIIIVTSVVSVLVAAVLIMLYIRHKRTKASKVFVSFKEETESKGQEVEA